MFFTYFLAQIILKIDIILDDASCFPIIGSG